MATYTDNRLITLNSKNATKYNGTYNSNCLFNFNGILKEEKDIVNAEIELINAQIPVSYYAINQTNNILNYTLGTTKTITISVGNYTSVQLINELKSKFTTKGDTFSITISFSTGNMKFTNTLDYTFNYSSSSLMPVLGFSANGISSSGVLLAPYPLNLGTITSLNILSDSLATYNYSSNSNLVNSIMTLNIDKSPWGIINFQSQSKQSRLLRYKIINSIDIKIQDQNGNFIDFNNINWNMTFSLQILRLLPIYSNLDFHNVLSLVGKPPPIPQVQNKPQEKTDDDLDLLTLGK